MNNDITIEYNLPSAFYEEIKPYLRTRSDHSATELLRLWQSALAYRKQYPKQQGSIAEWTVSAAAGSLLISADDLFEAIHAGFGSLEVPSADGNEAEWTRLEAMAAEAAQKIHT